MPIPAPRKDENHQDFIDRCMADEVMKEDYPDTKQRYAICSRSWDDAHGEGDKENMKNFTHNSTVADSEPDWGSVDKTSLPDPAFADKGEPGKKSTRKYPHHWVQNPGGKNDEGIYTTGTMYLHKGGLNAAWEAANGARSGQEASAAVKAHLQEHRRALGLDKNDSQGAFRGYSIKALADSANAEIWIYEEIGEGWFGGISAKRFKDDLLKLGKLENITVRINSPGGDVFDGLTIHNLLKQNAAKVSIYIDGLAASAASIIAMAGDEITMAENSFLMIHRAWGISMGNVEDMHAMAEALGKVDAALIKTYARRTGMENEKISEMMSAETWMNADEAIQMGFADQMVEDMKMAAHFDLDKFKYQHNPFKNENHRTADAMPVEVVPMHPNAERGTNFYKDFFARGQKKA